MVEYRTLFDENQNKEILKRYTKHVGAPGGLFTSTMRQNLLGINPKNPQPYNDTANFWADVRRTVKNGLIDLQLVCAISHPKQLRKMFEYAPQFPNEDQGGFISPEDLYTLHPNLTSVIGSILPSFHFIDDKEDLLWRADLAKRLASISIEFVAGWKNLIRSPVHLRHLKEVESILEAEISFYTNSR